MRATNRFDRIKQAVGWMSHNYPCGRPVEVRWVNSFKNEPDCVGETYRDGNKIIIRLKRTGCRRCLLETAVHEYVHAMQWGMASSEHKTAHHPPSFWAQYGEIIDRWDHDHGSEEADDF